MTVEYPIKRDTYIIHRIREDLFFVLDIVVEPIVRLILIKRLGEKPFYRYNYIEEATTRWNLEDFSLGSDEMVRMITQYIFEKANEEGCDVEITEDLMNQILDYKKELLGERRTS